MAKKQLQTEIGGIIKELQHIFDANIFLEHAVRYSELLRREFQKILKSRDIKAFQKIHTIRDRMKGSKLIQGLGGYDDIAAEYFHSPIIDDLIVEAQLRQKLFETISFEVAESYSIKRKEYVISPTDSDGVSPVIASGDGSFEEKGFQPRIETLLYLLQLEGIEGGDIEYYSGKIEKNMIRQTSYFTVYIKSLKKLVYVCNEIGNTTFIFHNVREEDLEDLDKFTKDEKKVLLEREIVQGTFIDYSKNWKTDVLDEIFGKEREGEILRLNRNLSPEEMEQLKNQIKKILETEGVLRIEDKEFPQEQGETLRKRVLMWYKTINPNKKYGIHKFSFGTLLAYFTGGSSKSYSTLESTRHPIRSLYVGEYEEEAFGNIDIEFEFADKEKKKQMVRNLLEAEGVLKVEEREFLQENGKLVKKRVLVWNKTVNPGLKYGSYKSGLCTLLGGVTGKSGAEVYTSFETLKDPIRTLYVGEYEEEGFGNIDIEFEFADKEKKRYMIKRLLEEEGIITIEEKESIGGNKKPVMGKDLVWHKKINPGISKGSYSMPFSTLLGKINGVNGRRVYTSFESIKDPIRSLYEGEYEREIFGNKGIEFEFADKEKKRQMVKNLLEKEGVLTIEEREVIKEDGEPIIKKILVWHKIINIQKKYESYFSQLHTLIEESMEVEVHFEYKSFEVVKDPIRSLYTGEYEEEAFGNKDMEFEFANEDTKKVLIRKFLEEEAFLKVEERETIKEDGESTIKKVLVWYKIVNPQKNYGNYSSPFSILLGKMVGVNGKKVYGSFERIKGPVEDLYRGSYSEIEYKIAA